MNIERHHVWRILIPISMLIAIAMFWGLFELAVLVWNLVSELTGLV